MLKGVRTAACLSTARLSDLRGESFGLGRLPEVSELRIERALERRPRDTALYIGAKSRVLRDDIRA
jgi:hypothetical protein